MSRFITIDGIETHFLEQGSGPSLVLLHGIGGPLMWQRIMDPLAESFRVIRLDLPGFGDSACPEEQFSTNDYAEFVTHFLRALSPEENIAVAGISYGGQIGLNAVARIENGVSRLVLINSTGLYRRNFFPVRNAVIWNLFAWFMRSFCLSNLRFICNLSKDSFYDLRNRPENLCRDFHRQILQPGKRDAWLQALKNIFTPDDTFRNNAKQIRIPVLIVAGENDATISPHYSEQLHSEIQNSRLVVFPKTAHSLPLEKPAELALLMKEFILSPHSENDYGR